MAVTLVQAVFRFRTDANAADAGTPTWAAAENTNYNPNVGDKFRLRFRVDNTGNTSSNTQAHNLYVSVDGGSYVTLDSQTHVSAVDATLGASADDSSIATGNFRLSAGSGTAVAGKYDSSGGIASHTIGGASYTEFEFGLQLNASARGHSLEFQIRKGTSAYNTYTVTPAIVIPGVTLTATALAVSAPVEGNPALLAFIKPFTPFTLSPPTIGAGALGVIINVPPVGIDLSAPTLGAPQGGLELAPISLVVASPVIPTLTIGVKLPNPVGFSVSAPTFGVPAPGYAGTGYITLIQSGTLLQTAGGTNHVQLMSSSVPGEVSFTPTGITVGSPVIGVAGVIGTFTAPNLVVASPSIGVPIIARPLPPVGFSTSAPVLGTPATGIVQGALSITVQAPTFSTPSLGTSHPTLFAVGLTPGGIVFTNPIMGFSIGVPSLAVGSPSIGTSQIFTAEVIPGLGITWFAPDIGVGELVEVEQPRAWLLEDEKYNEDGSKVTNSIHANYNDTIVIDTAGKTLLGNPLDEYGRVRSIHVKYPLQLGDDSTLSIDNAIFEAGEVADIAHVTALMQQIMLLSEQVAALAAIADQNGQDIAYLLNFGDPAQKRLIARGLTVALPEFGVGEYGVTVYQPPPDEPPPEEPPVVSTIAAHIALNIDAVSQLLLTTGDPIRLVGTGLVAVNLVVDRPNVGANLIVRHMIALGASAGLPVIGKPILFSFHG